MTKPKISLYTIPNRNMRKSICDVCKLTYRLKDMISVRDRWNYLYGLEVCKDCFERPNPQDRPPNTKETITSQPERVRDEGETLYETRENDDRLPEAPTNLKANIHPINTTVLLNWNAPLDAGSSPIIGYVVRQYKPQYGVAEDLSSNTGTPSTYYEDTTITIPGDYVGYDVAAINSFGTGPYSEIYYYPMLTDNPNYFYLGINNETATLGTSEGDLVVTPDV